MITPSEDIRNTMMLLESLAAQPEDHLTEAEMTRRGLMVGLGALAASKAGATPPTREEIEQLSRLPHRVGLGDVIDAIPTSRYDHMVRTSTPPETDSMHSVHNILQQWDRHFVYGDGMARFVNTNPEKYGPQIAELNRDLLAFRDAMKELRAARPVEMGRPTDRASHDAQKAAINFYDNLNSRIRSLWNGSARILKNSRPSEEHLRVAHLYYQAATKLVQDALTAPPR